MGRLRLVLSNLEREKGCEFLLFSHSFQSLVLSALWEGEGEPPGPPSAPSFRKTYCPDRRTVAMVLFPTRGELWGPRRSHSPSVRGPWGGGGGAAGGAGMAPSHWCLTGWFWVFGASVV